MAWNIYTQIINMTLQPYTSLTPYVKGVYSTPMVDKAIDRETFIAFFK